MVVLLINGIEYRMFNHLYAVARDGTVLKINRQTIIAPKLRKDGYQYVASKFLVHRMVATCWVDRPENSRDVHHINEIKTDNHAENLIWLSHKEHLALHQNFVGHYERTGETRQKLRDYRTGRRSTEETKAKQRAASLRLGIRPPPRPKGFKVPLEQLLAFRENHPKNTPCEVDGIVYSSFTKAGQALGIRPLTLRKRCLSANFLNYKVVKK